MEPPSPVRLSRILDSMNPGELVVAKDNVEKQLRNIVNRSSSIMETQKFLDSLGINHPQPKNDKERKEVSDILLDIYSEILKRQSK